MKKKLFYKELFSINIFNLNVFKSFLVAIISYEKYYTVFDKYFGKQVDLKNTIIYTYWHTESTYALQSLKNKYKYKLVSRIHGFDIYKERRIGYYMPLKRHFTKNIDKLFTITESASHYLHNTYGFKYNSLFLSRLGVENLNIISKKSNNNSFYIVSCAFLTEVKRVDKVIDALSILLNKNENEKINYNWTHLGGGELSDKISSYAKEKLEKYDNLEYTFQGNLNNQEIYKFYQNNPVDVFINTSKSEGVPVTIMEAMSCHIPIIAPDIGGIQDMVINNFNGILLSKESPVDEIANALEKIQLFKNNTIRNNSYALFLEKYDAKNNYKSFINEIINS